MFKIYTKTGDDGTTGLYQRGRVTKDSSVIEAIGAVDELNSFTGMLGAYLTGTEERMVAVEKQVAQIQNHLFDIGAAIAAPLDSDLLSNLEESLLTTPVEKQIDEMETELAPIKQFILPGGTLAASASHVCRSVCRNAERRVISYVSGLSASVSDTDSMEAESEAMSGDKSANSETQKFEAILKYMNRLSDYFFVLARFLNFKENRTDVFWQPIEGK